MYTCTSFSRQYYICIYVSLFLGNMDIEEEPPPELPSSSNPLLRILEEEYCTEAGVQLLIAEPEKKDTSNLPSATDEDETESVR